MSIRTPSPKAVREICARTLACLAASRRVEELRPSNRHAPNPEYEAAHRASRSAFHRLRAYFMGTGAMAPRGWPEPVAARLRRIRLMFGGFFHSPGPCEIPGLEGDLTFLLEAAAEAEMAAGDGGAGRPAGREGRSRPGPEREPLTKQEQGIVDLWNKRRYRTFHDLKKALGLGEEWPVRRIHKLIDKVRKWTPSD
jgi:hypothetical protein